MSLGISYGQLQSLLNCAIKRHEKIKTEQENRKIRINAAGGGRPEKLSTEEQVCLCLFYLRQMPTFQVLGMLFGVSKTEANDTAVAARAGDVCWWGRLYTQRGKLLSYRR